jgi:hypothetical protein
MSLKLDPHCQGWGSMTFWSNPDPLMRIQHRIRLLSSVTLRMPKKVFFSYFFSYNSLTGTLCSVLKILFYAKKNFILQALFQPLNTFMRKGKDLEPDPDPYLWLMDPESGPWGPKTWRSGSPTPPHGEKKDYGREMEGSYVMLAVLGSCRGGGGG